MLRIDLAPCSPVSCSRCGAAPRSPSIRRTRCCSRSRTSAERHIAFVYDGDVWIANRDGSGACRLTTAEGPESQPHFSPDGASIAFSGNYDGNIDVYVVPVAGGARSA